MSLPNPLMLPFMEAGGAISGANFGLYYTVLMQVGYNHFGKKALERVNNGESLQTILFDIQREIQPFNESMMREAIQSLPKVTQLVTQTLGEQAIPLLTGQYGVAPQTAKTNTDAFAGFVEWLQKSMPQIQTAYADTETYKGTTSTTNQDYYNEYTNFLRLSIEELSKQNQEIRNGTWIFQNDSSKVQALKDAYAYKLNQKRESGDILPSTTTPIQPAPKREAKPEEIELQKYIKRRTEDQRNLIEKKKQMEYQLSVNPKFKGTGQYKVYLQNITDARERIKRNVYDGTRWTGPNQWQVRTQAITDKNNRIWNQ